jgi:hypothetical protein
MINLSLHLITMIRTNVKHTTSSIPISSVPNHHLSHIICLLTSVLHHPFRGPIECQLWYVVIQYLIENHPDGQFLRLVV